MLNPNLILCAHLEDTDRTALPGDGIIRLKEAVEAIQATGFDSVWSVEMMTSIHWEWDPEVLTGKLKKRVGVFLNP